MSSPPAPDFCACCATPAAPASLDIVNRPGLSRIDWRIGSWASFRAAMIETLARGPRNPDDPDDPTWPAVTRAALAGLSRRDDADYAIMLMSLFAAIADVLAFYSERYANERWLRTATGRDSLERLAGLIGYRPAPGTAATAQLVFTLDRGAALRLAPGIRVMSVPGADERPQTFETIAGIQADARLNGLPVFGAPQPRAPFASGEASHPLLKRPAALVRGDRIMIVGASGAQLVEVGGLRAEPDGEYLDLVGAVSVTGSASVGFKVLRTLDLFGHNVPASYSFYDANPAVPAAQRWVTRSAGPGVGQYAVSLAAGLARYPLATKVEGLRPGAMLLVDCGPAAVPRYAFAIVGSIVSGSATLGPMTDTVDQVALQPIAPLIGSDAYALLAGTGLPAIPDVRATRIYVLDPQALVTRSYRYPASVTGSSVHVRGDLLDDFGLLAKKRAFILMDGKRLHAARVTSVGVAPAGSDGVTHLEIGFTPPLGTPMTRPILHGNVAAASHGETRPDETLGHGDGARVFQRFRLQRGPLTRLAGGTGGRPAAELAVRVNDALWQEVDSLFGHGPDDRVYTVREGDDGLAEIGFGDGRTGARLPSGAANVVARYRTGSGAEGRVRAGQLATLLTRPPGLAGVTNPLPADGGRDPETLEDARTGAPASVRTFGRAIALDDFEAVARETGLVARARTSWAWIGLERAVQLTVAGPEGARLSAAAMADLRTAMARVRDVNHALVIGNLWRVPVTIAARLMRDPAWEPDLVEANGRAALRAFMSFDARPIGRPLHLSQIIAALQAAPGVAAVDVDRFEIAGIGGWTAAQRARRAAGTEPVQPFIRIFDARPLRPAAELDPLALAGLALDPDAPALPAEQPFIADPAADLALTVVEAL